MKQHRTQVRHYLTRGIRRSSDRRVGSHGPVISQRINVSITENQPLFGYGEWLGTKRSES